MERIHSRSARSLRPAYSSRFLTERGSGTSAANLFVHAQALVLFRDIGRRDTDVEAQIDCRGELRPGGLAAQLTHGAFEHLAIKFQPNGIHMAVLLPAEQVPGAAQLHVEGRHAKA